MTSASRNASLLEQFEIALRRTSVESAHHSSALISNVIHDTNSPLTTTNPTPSAPQGIRKRAVSNSLAFLQSTFYATNSQTGKKYSLVEGLNSLGMLLYQFLFDRKKFDWRLFLEISLGLNQIVCDHVAETVKQHKDIVLLCGMPGLFFISIN